MSRLPAETHQHGVHPVTPDEVLELVLSILGDDGPDRPSENSLEQLGLTDAHVWDLWACVCNELGERSMGPDLDATLWTPSTTLERLAVLMAAALTGADPWRIGVER